MAQHDYVIANGTGAAVRSDLNNALAAIVSNNSGATEPATMYAYQWWADTSTGLLKLRNAANNAWITLRELDGTLTIEDGTASSPGLAFADDLNTGIYSPSADQLGITTGGTVRLTTTTTGITSALPVDVPLGTASAPTVTFTGDLDTGIYSPGANQVAISTNGAGRLFVDSSGRVGVGTSSPGYLLTVSGGATSLAANNYLRFGGGIFASGDGSVDNYLFSGSNAITVRNAADNASLVTIKNSGAVGIGDTAPSAKLVCNGHIQITSNGTPTTGAGLELSYGQINASRTSQQSYNRTGAAYLGADYDALDYRWYISGSEKARLDSSGRLLVGTSSADSFPSGGSGRTPRFQVKGDTTDNGSISITRTQTLPICFFNAGASGTNVSSNDGLGRIIFNGYHTSSYYEGAYIGAEVDSTPGANDMPTRLVFSTTADGASSPTERMRIQNDGITLVNRTTARNYITSGTAVLQTSIGGLLVTNGSTDGQYAMDRISFNGGQFYVLNASSTGVILSSGGTSWGAQSDERTKTDLQPISNGLEKVNSLRAVTGRYKSDDEGVSRSFLIAQDVQAVLPEAVSVTDDEDSTLSLRYTEVIPLLVAALKESKERIETLEAKVAALEAA